MSRTIKEKGFYWRHEPARSRRYKNRIYRREKKRSLEFDMVIPIYFKDRGWTYW